MRATQGTGREPMTAQGENLLRRGSARRMDRRGPCFLAPSSLPKYPRRRRWQRLDAAHQVSLARLQLGVEQPQPVGQVVGVDDAVKILEQERQRLALVQPASVENRRGGDTRLRSSPGRRVRRRRLGPIAQKPPRPAPSPVRPRSRSAPDASPSRASAAPCSSARWRSWPHRRPRSAAPASSASGRLGHPRPHQAKADMPHHVHEVIRPGQRGIGVLHARSA